MRERWTTGEEDLVLDTDELFLEREPFLERLAEPIPVSLLSDPLLTTSEKTGSECTRGRDGRTSAIVEQANSVAEGPSPDYSHPIPHHTADVTCARVWGVSLFVF